jgi:hypothetical protein
MKNTPRREYIATVAFNNDFYTYTQTTLPTGAVIGKLVPVAGANLENCPAGRVLRETSRKLYPNDATPGIFTPLVGVYDEITFLSGFIDPNCPVYGVYSTDSSYFFKTGVNPATGLVNVGPPVYTYGTIATTAAVTGRVYFPGLFNPGFGQVPYDNILPNADLFIDPTLGNMYQIDLTLMDNSNLSGTINCYLRDPVQPTTDILTPKSQILTLIFYNSSGVTPTVQFYQGDISGSDAGFYQVNSITLPTGGSLPPVPFAYTIEFALDGRLALPITSGAGTSTGPTGSEGPPGFATNTVATCSTGPTGYTGPQ